jgi:hypothetical protein
MAAREKGKAQDQSQGSAVSKVDPMENPASGDETSGTFFLDPSLFPEGPEVGDTVFVEAEVRSIGSKIALAPVEIKSEAEEEGDEGSGQDESQEEEGPQGRAKNAKERFQLK